MDWTDRHSGTDAAVDGACAGRAVAWTPDPRRLPSVVATRPMELNVEDKEFGQAATLDAMVEMMAIILAGMKEEDRAITHVLLEAAEQRRYDSDLFPAEYARAFASLRRRVTKVSHHYSRKLAEVRRGLDQDLGGERVESAKRLPTPKDGAGL